jgi:L-2-hydroxyglutarate oxidase LhgO
MDEYLFLDAIIQKLNPREIPAEYISAARIVDNDGIEQIYYGKDIEPLLKNPQAFLAMEASIIVDVYKVKSAMIEDIESAFKEIAGIY